MFWVLLGFSSFASASIMITTGIVIERSRKDLSIPVVGEQDSALAAKCLI